MHRILALWLVAIITVACGGERSRSAGSGGALPPGGPDDRGTYALFGSALERHASDDGPGCLGDLDRFARAGGRDPRFEETYARCLMQAGKCEEGAARLRQLRDATSGLNPAWPNREPDRGNALRDEANQWCPSGTATNAADYVVRASREMGRAIKSRSADGCRDAFERIDQAMPEAYEVDRKAVMARGPDASVGAWAKGTWALDAGASCIAAATGRCVDGLPYYRRYYARALHGAADAERHADEAWATKTQVNKQLACR